MKLSETRGFPSPFLNGFGFVRCRLSLPSGRGLREATLGHLGIGPLHKNLEKRWSEPRSVGKLGKMMKENGALVKRILAKHQVTISS